MSQITSTALAILPDDPHQLAAGDPGVGHRCESGDQDRRQPRRLTRLQRTQRGMTTAEYAVGTVAAAGFGGILFKILTDPQVREALLRFVLWLIGQFVQMNPF